MNGICLIWSRGQLISPSLPVGDDRYLNLTKATHGPKSRGKSFGTTLWHHVQRYCCLGVLFAHAQVPSNSRSYHIRGNEMNCLGSSEFVILQVKGVAPGIQLSPLRVWDVNSHHETIVFPARYRDFHTLPAQKTLLTLPTALL